MNRWAFLATQKAMVVAHLWTPVPDSDRLRPVCETRHWQVLPLNLAWPRRGFRKCKRCIPFENRAIDLLPALKDGVSRGEA